MIVASAVQIDGEALDCVYSQVIDGMRQDDKFALLGSFFINVRRVISLFMAMYLNGDRWIQLHTFITLNFMSFVFTLKMLPYETISANIINVINEFVGLFVSYILLI